jgi:hypothetical protein
MNPIWILIGGVAILAWVRAQATGSVFAPFGSLNDAAAAAASGAPRIPRVLASSSLLPVASSTPALREEAVSEAVSASSNIFATAPGVAPIVNNPNVAGPVAGPFFETVAPTDANYSGVSAPTVSPTMDLSGAPNTWSQTLAGEPVSSPGGSTSFNELGGSVQLIAPSPSPYLPPPDVSGGIPPPVYGPPIVDYQASVIPIDTMFQNVTETGTAILAT